MLDSVTSSAHFSTPALVGATLGAGAVPPSFWLAIVAFFCWGMASHAFGAVQDVLADRAGGLASIATELGARGTTRIATVLYAAASLLLFCIQPTGWIVGVVDLGYVGNTARFWKVTDATSATVNPAWRVFIWLNYCCGAVVTTRVLLTSTSFPLR